MAKSSEDERLLVLIERAEGAEADELRRLLLGEFAPALRDTAGVTYLSLHLANETPGMRRKTAPTFDGLLELAMDEGSGWEAALPRDPTIGAAHAYRVARRHVKHCPHPGSAGEPTPGLYMISPVLRAEGLSHADFDAHWRDRHTPLALKHHPGMWDYRQSPVLEVLTAGSTAWDGISHMGFPSFEAFREGLFDSDEGKRIIFEDTARFLDLDPSRAVLMTEYVLKG